MWNSRERPQSCFQLEMLAIGMPDGRPLPSTNTRNCWYFMSNCWFEDMHQPFSKIRKELWSVGKYRELLLACWQLLSLDSYFFLLLLFYSLLPWWYGMSTVPPCHGKNPWCLDLTCKWGLGEGQRSISSSCYVLELIIKAQRLVW